MDDSVKSTIYFNFFLFIHISVSDNLQSVLNYLKDNEFEEFFFLNNTSYFLSFISTSIDNVKRVLKHYFGAKLLRSCPYVVQNDNFY